MRIVIDLQGAQSESRMRGIGRYVLDWTDAMIASGHDHDIFLLLSGHFPDGLVPLRKHYQAILGKERVRVWHSPGPLAGMAPGGRSQLRDIAARLRYATLRALRPDWVVVGSLFEGFDDGSVTTVSDPNPAAQYPPTWQTAVIAHDLIPWLYPTQYLPTERHRSWYQERLWQLQQADVLLAISESTRSECITHGSIAPDRIHTISSAVDGRLFTAAAAAETLDPLVSDQAFPKDFLLTVGGADPRKNMLGLLDAYRQLEPSLIKHHPLLIVGHLTPMTCQHYQDHARRLGLPEDALWFLGQVSDQALVRLYRQCRLSVFPSLHEAFGLPVLEAMALGVPVIAGNCSSLPEVVGWSEALFDPKRPESMAQLMQRGLTDDAFRQRLMAHGLSRASQFSWSAVAAKSWQVLTTAQHQLMDSLPAVTKPTLAWVSPLPPLQTGIAGYSAKLLATLDQHYQLTLVSDQSTVDPAIEVQWGPIRDMGWLFAEAHRFDRVVYHLGNAPFHLEMLETLESVPGMVVLHDVYLSGLYGVLKQHAKERWQRAVMESHGHLAIAAFEKDPASASLKFPVHGRVLDHARGLIVHSKHAKALAMRWSGPHQARRSWAVPMVVQAEALADPQAAKVALGLDPEAVVIASFGHVNTLKQHARLLSCWLDSALSCDPRVQLVFVGACGDPQLADTLRRQIECTEVGARFDITGFVSDALYRTWLAATDLAVQLRTHSRGETSGALFECLASGIPTIVNAHGSFAELDPAQLWMLPEHYEDAALADLMTAVLGQREAARTRADQAKTCIQATHHPEACALAYAEAIEACYSTDPVNLVEAIESVGADVLQTVDDNRLAQIGSSVAINHPPPRARPRVYLDVTPTARNDLKTGIQRVVRALSKALLPMTGACVFVPVVLEHDGQHWVYREAHGFADRLFGTDAQGLMPERIDPVPGDVLLILDLFTASVVADPLYRAYQGRGVRVYQLVYDLLPIQYPEFFSEQSESLFAAWLRMVSGFDGQVCISQWVAEQLRAWQLSEQITHETLGFSPMVTSFRLGSDLAASAPTDGFPANMPQLLACCSSGWTCLMVGTVEPRKGHAWVLATMEHLWAEGVAVTLIIVGKRGWMMDGFCTQLQDHPRAGRDLFWLDSASDACLEALYGASTCLIAGSEAEGFGLPLVEAARHGLPVLARDIPVFREVCGEGAYYLSDGSPERRAADLLTWKGLFDRHRHPKPEDVPQVTWQSSAESLLAAIGLDAEGDVRVDTSEGGLPCHGL